MKNISIITFINIIFFIALIAILSTFLLFLQFDKNRYRNEVFQRYHIISKGFLFGLEFIPTKEELNRILKEYNVILIKDEKLKLNILRNYREIFRSESLFGRVRVYKVKNDFFIYVQKFGYNLFLKDEKPKVYHYLIASTIFGILFFIILIIYILLRQKIKPLAKLKKSVDRFAKGDLSVKFKKNGDDEVGKIAESFNQAVHYINRLIESKNLFMRNMMHELKTPVTKGRIVSEMLPNDKNKEILIKVFERINEIIDELSQIEKLKFDILKLNKQEYKLSLLIEKSRELLMIKRGQILFNGEDISLIVDKKLFILALKNLIHNGIKFSSDKRVIITAKRGIITISSKSKPLTKDLSYYLEPFYQEEKREEGLGIGLYIVDSILKAHNFKLKYNHSQEYTNFIILKEIEVSQSSEKGEMITL